MNCKGYPAQNENKTMIIQSEMGRMGKFTETVQMAGEPGELICPTANVIYWRSFQFDISKHSNCTSLFRSRPVDELTQNVGIYYIIMR
jgi:hypothetical protein